MWLDWSFASRLKLDYKSLKLLGNIFAQSSLTDDPTQKRNSHFIKWIVFTKYNIHYILFMQLADFFLPGTLKDIASGKWRPPGHTLFIQGESVQNKILLNLMVYYVVCLFFISVPCHQSPALASSCKILPLPSQLKRRNIPFTGEELTTTINTSW